MNHPSTAGVGAHAPAHVRHAGLIAWVAEIAALTQAADVYWCDGSQQEYDRYMHYLEGCTQYFRSGHCDICQFTCVPV